jgi:hypothetical protein
VCEKSRFLLLRAHVSSFVHKYFTYFYFDTNASPSFVGIKLINYKMGKGNVGLLVCWEVFGKRTVWCCCFVFFFSIVSGDQYKAEGEAALGRSTIFG